MSFERQLIGIDDDPSVSKQIEIRTSGTQTERSTCDRASSPIHFLYPRQNNGDDLMAEKSISSAR